MNELAALGGPLRPDWEALDARLRPYLRRRLPSAADVDDVMQEVLLRVMKGLPQLEDETRLPVWMVQIARNAVADFYRRAELGSRRLDADPASPKDPNEDGEEAERQRLEHILAVYVGHVARELPEPYREAIQLTELEGLTQKEAAARLGVPLSTLKSRVQRGRTRIRAQLDACCRVGLDGRGRVQTCEPLDTTCGPRGCASPSSTRPSKAAED